MVFQDTSNFLLYDCGNAFCLREAGSRNNGKQVKQPSSSYCAGLLYVSDQRKGEVLWYSYEVGAYKLDQAVVLDKTVWGLIEAGYAQSFLARSDVALETVTDEDLITISYVQFHYRFSMQSIEDSRLAGN